MCKVIVGGSDGGIRLTITGRLRRYFQITGCVGGPTIGDQTFFFACGKRNWKLGFANTVMGGSIDWGRFWIR